MHKLYADDYKMLMKDIKKDQRNEETYSVYELEDSVKMSSLNWPIDLIQVQSEILVGFIIAIDMMVLKIYIER